MTDGEVDDRSSMVRFLLYTNDIDLLAIIETNSVYQKDGHSRSDWYDEQVNVYEKVHPNLIIHDPDYPTADEIRRKSLFGDEDREHLMKVTSRDGRNAQKPGREVEYMPNDWPDTPGSDKIVEILLDEILNLFTFRHGEEAIPHPKPFTNEKQSILISTNGGYQKQ